MGWCPCGFPQKPHKIGLPRSSLMIQARPDEALSSWLARTKVPNVPYPNASKPDFCFDKEGGGRVRHPSSQQPQLPNPGKSKSIWVFLFLRDPTNCVLPLGFPLQPQKGDPQEETPPVVHGSREPWENGCRLGQGSVFNHHVMFSRAEYFN